MKQDIIIAGVGGQGILTIARVLSMVAISNGKFVKQAEVHGMSQRGGAVYSHLRISDSEIFSDLIPVGSADMVLAIEPMEALRYAPLLRDGGTIVASTNAVVNIPDYPGIESVLAQIATYPNHIAIDMEKLARAAGGVLASNIVAIGAASLSLGFSLDELQQTVEVLFALKGERVVQANIRALRFGRTAAVAYCEAIARGVEPQHARGWIASISPDHLASEEDLDFSELGHSPEDAKLTGAEAHAFESLLMSAHDEGRKVLYEHEVYRLIELVGGIAPPRHTFIPKGSTISEEALQLYPGDRVVLKLVSSKIVHKTDVAAVLILPKDHSRIRAEIDQMIARHAPVAPVAGVLLVEYVEHDSSGLGTELFVGIRATREFGPVIAAGLGGVQTEYLAAKMLPGIAVAKAPVADVSADEFLELFRKCAAYDVIAGRVRGHTRLVSDGVLLQCFRAFISIARQFCVDRGEAGPDIAELEVNPFAFSGQRLIPLDGRGSLRPADQGYAPRPIPQAHRLLEPKSIAIVGMSAKDDSLSRVILANILESGFVRDNITVIKHGQSDFQDLRCVPRIDALENPVDLLVICVPASSLPDIVTQCAASGKVHSGIIISGGAGETKDSESIGQLLSQAIERGRTQTDGGPVFLGPNCMGVRSLPGRYDTFFVPKDKLPTRTDLPPQPIALISQSGAFLVSRLSSQVQLNPRFAISIGNQCDLTVSDLLRVMVERDDIQVVGVYLEGFKNLDGIAALRAIEALRDQGKSVVFYKAGRTDSGRSAAAGHTAAVAGDYDICRSAMQNSGAIIAGSFREFGLAIDLACAIGHKTMGQGRVFAVTNAGMEAVSIGDTGIRLDPSSEPLSESILATLRANGLDGLVSPRNPLDLTPQANELAYDQVVRAALNDESVDAVIVSCVPLAPTLRTLATDLADPHGFVTLAQNWIALSDKPIVFAVDGGPEYNALATQLQSLGIAVFRSADEAARCLRIWIEHKEQCSARDLPHHSKQNENNTQRVTPGN